MKHCIMVVESASVVATKEHNIEIDMDIENREQAENKVPVKKVVVGIEGEIVEENWL